MLSNVVCLCPFFSIAGLYKAPAELDYIWNVLLLWDLDTFCLLLSGWGDTFPITSTLSPSLNSSPLSSSRSSSPSFPLLPFFSLACDRGRVMTEVSAQVTVILSCRCSHWPGSRYIPLSSWSPSVCSLCSQDPHSWLSRAPTVQVHRGLVTPVYSGREVCVNVSNPSSLFFYSSRLLIVYLTSLSLFIHTVLLV